MRSLNTLEFAGASLIIVGSFLPWERAGDWISIPSYGIRVDIASFKYWISGIHVFPVHENGGVLAILLTSVIMILIHRPPQFIKIHFVEFGNFSALNGFISVLYGKVVIS